jgi:hypothetical protein
MRKINVFCDHDLVVCAHVSAGLCDIRHMGIADMRFSLTIGSRKRFYAPVVLRMLLQDQKAKTRVAFDFHDDHNCWDEEIIAWSDIYWKSNYHSQFFPKMATAQVSKIRPYGLYFPTRSVHDRSLGSRWMGSALVNINYRFTKNGHFSVGDILSAVQRIKRYKSRLMVKSYESTTLALTRPFDIYFNPGCWPMDVLKNKEVNFTRSKLIKLLRDEFPGKFLGGFVSNSVSKNYFADEICDEVTNHFEYVQALHNAKIVVSTNGLGGCHSWRTAEALAAGCVLVTERPVNQVDENFINGENVFFFDTPDECKGICENILRLEPMAFSRLQEASRRYYTEYVAPQKSLVNKLKSIGYEMELSQP